MALIRLYDLEIKDTQLPLDILEVLRRDFEVKGGGVLELSVKENLPEHSIKLWVRNVQSNISISPIVVKFENSYNQYPVIIESFTFWPGLDKVPKARSKLCATEPQDFRDTLVNAFQKDHLECAMSALADTSLAHG